VRAAQQLRALHYASHRIASHSLLRNRVRA
jgi:hypothetical protein